MCFLAIHSVASYVNTWTMKITNISCVWHTRGATRGLHMAMERSWEKEAEVSKDGGNGCSEIRACDMAGVNGEGAREQEHGKKWVTVVFSRVLAPLSLPLLPVLRRLQRSVYQGLPKPRQNPDPAESWPGSKKQLPLVPTKGRQIAQNYRYQ